MHLTLFLPFGVNTFMNKDLCIQEAETDSQRESRMTAIRGEWAGDGGIEQKGKRTHGHAQQCDDCWGYKGTKW